MNRIVFNLERYVIVYVTKEEVFGQNKRRDLTITWTVCPRLQVVATLLLMREMLKTCFNPGKCNIF